MRRIATWAAGTYFIVVTAALAAPVKTHDITLTSGSDTIAGYLAVPDSPGRHPGLVVLHEDAGFSEWVKGEARKLAEAGYVALAIDLYRGQVAHDPAYAYDLMAGTPPDRALRDMEAAIHLLAARPDVNKEKLGAIGWSAGGKWSLLLAVNDLFLAGCVANYGALPTDAAEIQKIRAPVLGIFGAEDRTISPSDVEAFENAMTKAHKSVDIKIYPGVGHGFENPANKLYYSEYAAGAAWQRTLAFLDEHLKR